MCEVCERNKPDLKGLLADFLQPGVEVELVKHEEGYQELLLFRDDKSMTLTADGDEGGYFHWSPEAERPAPEPAKPVRADGLDLVQLPHAPMGGRDGRLSSALTPTMITQRLGFKSIGGSGDGKSKYGWYFTLDGVPCGIWDYKGSRWSYQGTEALMQKLFGRHVGQ